MSSDANRILKLLGWILGAAALLIGGGLWFLDRTLGSGMCETTIYSENRAPDGLVARVQMTDCGATTGFSRVVMIEKPGIWSQECRAVALDGEPTVKVAWSDDSLIVTHNATDTDIIAVGTTCFGRKIKVHREP